MLTISKNGFNLVSVLLNMVLLFNIAATITANTTTILPSVNSANPTISTNVSTTDPPSTTNSTTVASTIRPIRGPLPCEYAKAQNVNMTRFLGVWFEAVRKTKDSNSQACNELDFKNETNHISVNSTYSTNPSELWVHNSTYYETNIVEGVFNITDEDGVKTYKILETDYNFSAFICNYRVNNSQIPVIPTTTNTPTETTPSGAAVSEFESSNTNAVFILVRSRNLSLDNDFVTYLTGLAQDKSLDFNNLTTVNQSDECIKKNGASTLMPMLTMIMAVVLAVVIKF